MLSAQDRQRLAANPKLQSWPEDAYLLKPITSATLFAALQSAKLEPANSPQRESGGQARQQLRGLRLLLVEDNPLNQQVAYELLSLCGAQVSIASGGIDGVRQALAADPPFAAVLMDLQMPDIDGFEATRRLLSAPDFNGAPIIAMTANVFAADIERCLAAGMADHIKKPIDLQVLIDTLLRHCQVAGDLSADPLVAAPAKHVKTAYPRNPESLDSAAAIQRLGGDSALHTRLLRAFSNGALANVDELENCIAAQQWLPAMRCMHTLKGNASTVGAMALAQLAEEAEGRYQQRLSMAADRPFEQQADARLLAQLRAQIAPLLTAASSAATICPASTSLPGSASFDRTALSASLSELAGLLAQHNMRATRLFAQLKEQYGAALGSQLDALEQAVDTLDMAQALQACNGLQQIIDDEAPAAG